MRAALIASLAGGAASGLIYSSIILSVAFLVPVQVVFGRSGWAAGAGAAGVSTLVIAAALGTRMAQAGVFDGGALVSGIAPSVALLAALLLMNARVWKGRAVPFRSILPAAACALLATPLLASAASDRSIQGVLEELLGGMLSSVKGEAYEVSPLAAAIDPAALAGEMMALLYKSFAATLFMILGGSWMVGNRLSGGGSAGRSLVGPIDGYRLPFWAVWPFLATWASVLAVVALKAPVVPSAIAWNLAIAAALAYAPQGLGIATVLLKRWGVPRPLRIAIAVTAALALISPSGVAVAIVVPLLGITETWIPYRNPKGVGA